MLSRLKAAPEKLAASMRRELNKDEAVGYEGEIAESARLIGGPMVLREGVVVAVSLVALFNRLTSHSTFCPCICRWTIKPLCSDQREAVDENGTKMIVAALLFWLFVSA